MEAQLHHPSHGHHGYEEDPHNVGLHSVVEGKGEGEGEHHHHGEKKSVLKKVKNKAKKIKDAIKKHSHIHDHERHNRRQDIYQEGYESDDNDEEEEEVVNDPEVHGAPMYESSVIRSVSIPLETNTNLEKPIDDREDRYEHNLKDQGQSRPWAPGHRVHESENKSTLPTGPGPIGRNKPNLEEAKIKSPVGLEEDPHSPNNSPAYIPPSNSQSKVTDPTGVGGKETHVVPPIREFGNLNVLDAPVSKPESEQRPDIGSPYNPESKHMAEPETPGLNQKGQDTVADKAASAKDMVASKLGYGGDQQEGHDSSYMKPISESASEYAHKVAETLAPVYEKVAGAGTAVMSKVRGSGEGSNDGVSMKEYLSEKFKPGDEDKALSEVITEAVGGQGEEKRVGKVTVSEEVAARLGTGQENKREGEDAVAAGQESAGQGVVDRLKDAVGSWLGKSTGIETAQESIGKSYVSDVGSGSSGIGTR